ncbi:hypothetical protein [Halobellus sp. H-GB7]|uniref:hypothetical protein n=1 Tax=Halobellus sp. H-GB7 TaxID=3069756 RepID=UPI0027B8435F|nr:hypothetical protein [Halobellus sp. H-GB7]MDQ2053719.1 hypothetical protein [Halobellus sp. H-GB7]
MTDFLLQIPVLGLEFDRLVVLLIAAFAGGAFGAAIGALPAFIFTGFVVFLGEGLAILQREVSGLDLVPQGELATGVTGVIGFGAVTGPHISFAGGVAAAAYAAKRYPEMEPDGWAYHFGKNIGFALGPKSDILAVGGLFGVLGLLVTRLVGGLGLPTDGIAVSVFVTAIIARVAFGYSILGQVGGTSLFDMSPFEREEPRVAPDGGTIESRLATEPWLPHQYEWSGVAALGVVAGVLSGYIWLETGSVFMGYAISAISLLFLNLGVDRIPVTHHMTLLGSVGAILVMPALGSEPAALLAAGALGGITGVVAEVSQRVFYSHGETHVDPPAISIAVVMLAVGVLYLLGLLPNAGYLGL